MNLEKILEEINIDLEKIKNSRPLSKIELQELRKSLGVMFVQNSNAIEGNTYTLGETKLLLEDGITVGGKTLKEQNEVLNHRELLSILYNFLEKDIQINEDLVLKIHKNVLKNIDNESSGVYRKIQNYISGDDLIPPKALDVPKLMNKLIFDLNNDLKNNKKNIVQIVGNFHYDFAKIHPFIDGNGRTIRLLVNMILMKNGFPMIIIPNIRRGEYISNLSSYKTKNDFLVFFADIVLQNLRDYMIMIGI